MYDRQKLKSTIKTWINAEPRKIWFCSYVKLRKIMFNILSRFGKILENIQGPSVLKVLTRQCRVTVLYTFSQEAGFLFFYVKPLVRKHYYFYMSDQLNAVYSIMCPIVTICAGKRMLKTLRNHQIVGTVPNVQF